MAAADGHGRGDGERASPGDRFSTRCAHRHPLGLGKRMAGAAVWLGTGACRWVAWVAPCWGWRGSHQGLTTHMPRPWDDVSSIPRDQARLCGGRRWLSACSPNLTHPLFWRGGPRAQLVCASEVGSESNQKDQPPGCAQRAARHVTRDSGSICADIPDGNGPNGCHQ